jgi:hypothetical protein
LLLHCYWHDDDRIWLRLSESVFYSTTAGEWEQLEQVIKDSGVIDYFATSVAISIMGNRMAIGVPFSIPKGKDSGLVSVYH